jgi:hypothetical protein
VQESIPIYLAAIGPKNTALGGEIADGWLPTLLSPEHLDEFRPLLAEGAARTPGKSLEGFDIAPDGERDGLRRRRRRPGRHAALPRAVHRWMGSREQNFYNGLAVRYGFGDAARRVQDLYLDGKRDEAGAALPDELIDRVTLCGPAGQVRERLEVYSAAGRRDHDRLPHGLHGGRAARAAPAGRRAGRRLTRVQIFLGAFGDPGHAFPMLALGSRLVERGHTVCLQTWKRWEHDARAAGMEFAAAPEYQVFPTEGEPLKPYAAAVQAARETVPQIARFAPDLAVSDILTPAPALAAELCGVPLASLVPHVLPLGAPGHPVYSIGARLPRTRFGRRGWRSADRLVRTGLEQGRGSTTSADGAWVSGRCPTCTRDSRAP